MVTGAKGSDTQEGRICLSYDLRLSRATPSHFPLLELRTEKAQLVDACLTCRGSRLDTEALHILQWHRPLISVRERQCNQESRGQLDTQAPVMGTTTMRDGKDGVCGGEMGEEVMLRRLYIGGMWTGDSMAVRNRWI